MSAQTPEEKEAAKAAAVAAKEEAEKEAADQAANEAAAAIAAENAVKPGRTWITTRDPDTGVVSTRLE